MKKGRGTYDRCLLHLLFLMSMYKFYASSKVHTWRVRLDLEAHTETHLLEDVDDCEGGCSRTDGSRVAATPWIRKPLLE